MVDLDHFKVFNDVHGHAAGDELLKSAAASWRLALRTTDFVARYGGEEFAVLLQDCARAEAESLIERFQAATPKGQTCSVGIAYWERSDTPEELVARADGAMYEAKRLGRDRVVSS
jgi:diguanylate cyclase (GGDEF)-like protein